MKMHPSHCSLSLAETKKIEWNWIMQIWHCSSPSQRQIAFLGPLERRYGFGPKSNVSCYQKLVFRSAVRFLFLFVLMDAILLTHLPWNMKKVLRRYPFEILCGNWSLPYTGWKKPKSDTTSKDQLFMTRYFAQKDFFTLKVLKMWLF